MADAVTFTPEAARRIAEAVRRVERTGRDMACETPIKHPTEPEFWALLTGVDLTGLRYTFVRVIPDASLDRADFTLKNIAYRIAGEEPEAGLAREANGNKVVRTFSIARIHFIGYDADNQPAYLFEHHNDPDDGQLRPHDHRSNDDGGFAFSVYHPGTNLPQSPWGQ